MSQVDGRQIRRQSTQAQYSCHTNATITIHMTSSYPNFIIQGFHTNHKYWDLYQIMKSHAAVAAATTPAHGANVVITAILGGYRPQRSLEEVNNLQRLKKISIK
jgi:hypothetical protein